MSTYTAYTRLEKAIAAADANSIRQRWEYGRRVLCDRVKTTDAGNLRNGALAALIAAARRADIKLSEREIQHRLQAGKSYPCKDQITHICASYESWGALRAAGFPAIDAEPGEEPYDPRDVTEKARTAEKQLHLDDPDQLALFEFFPDDRFSELSTLADLAKYADEMAVLTERYARRDRERAEYLKRLASAVDGDLSKTWAEAQAALDQRT
jgi:hypothetical protein